MIREAFGATAMLEADRYRQAQLLRNGRSIEVRALRPGDRAALIAAVERTSAQSLYRRFFSPKRHFSETEIGYFVDVDFVNHVALVATLEEGDRPIIVGGARYVVVRPARAEVAVAVVDQYQGQGIGAALLQHLVIIARRAGLKQLIAEVLADNTSMLRVFERSGLPVTTMREGGLTHVVLELR